MSRLRPISTIDHYGYVSRVDGDQRLIDHKNQEDFFSVILAKTDLSPIVPVTQQDAESDLCSSSKKEPKSSLKSDTDCLASLRKLREGIIAAKRQDAFAMNVLERTIKFAILVGHEETYLPCMRHLLKDMYPQVEMSIRHVKVRREISELYLLHLCSMSQYDDYYQEKTELQCLPGLSDDVIRSIIQGNWMQWHRIRQSADMLQQLMIDKTQKKFAGQAFSCISAAYMRVEASWVTRVCGSNAWLADEGRAQWSIDGSWVVLKKPKKAFK